MHLCCKLALLSNGVYESHRVIKDRIGVHHVPIFHRSHMGISAKKYKERRTIFLVSVTSQVFFLLDESSQ